MDRHRLMLFKFGQNLTLDVAVNIGRFCGLPAATIDEIERKNPGTTLIRNLEQRLIISKDLNKLREFHTTLKALQYFELAEIMEETYPQLKQVTPASPPPAPSVPQNSGSASSTKHESEITDGGRPVMFPASAQVSSQALPGGSASFIKRERETSVTGGPIMSPTSSATSDGPTSESRGPFSSPESMQH